MTKIGFLWSICTCYASVVLCIACLRAREPVVEDRRVTWPKCGEVLKEVCDLHPYLWTDYIEMVHVGAIALCRHSIHKANTRKEGRLPLVVCQR